METFEITAEPRQEAGKGASRRLRRTGRIPAILYGAGKEPQALSLSHNDLLRHLEHEAFFSHILDIKVGGKVEKAVLKDLHRHPSKAAVLHADFLRVSAKQKLHMHVPLHFVNENKSPAKRLGALISHQLVEVQVSCLPKDLPEFIEVDLSSLEDGQSIHVSELLMPPGVELVRHGGDADQSVVSAHRGGKGVGEVHEEAGGEPGEEEGIE